MARQPHFKLMPMSPPAFRFGLRYCPPSGDRLATRPRARAIAFESKLATTLIVATRTQSSDVSTDIAATLAKTGQSEEEFKTKLHAAISHAAGIPNAQWEKFATDPRPSTAGIEGEPLSMLLLSLNPPTASKDSMTM